MQQWAIFWAAILGLAALAPSALAMQTPCPPTDAEACLLQAAKDHPEDFAAQRALGEYYLRNHRLPRGIAYMEKAHHLRPDDYPTGYDLSLAWIDAGQMDLAEQQLKGMRASHETAEVDNLLAEIDARSGRFKEAAVQYHRAAELDPTENNIFDLASFLLQHSHLEGFLSNAASFFRYGVQKYPGSPRMTVGLGVTLYAQGQYEEAVRTLCAAVDRNPSDPRPYEFLGKVSKNAPALLPEIRSRLENFVRLYPDNGAASYYYAMILWQRVDGPNSGDGSAGESALTSTNEQTVEALLKKAIAADPKLYEAHFQLGVLYQDRMRYEDAITQFNQTLRLRPDYNRAHYRLALLYNRTHQKTLADQHLALLKQIKKEDADADERGETPAAVAPTSQ